VRGHFSEWTKDTRRLSTSVPPRQSGQQWTQELVLAPLQGCLTLLWPGTAEEYSSKCSRFNPVAFHLENPKTAPIHTLVLPRGPPTCG